MRDFVNENRRYLTFGFAVCDVAAVDVAAVDVAAADVAAADGAMGMSCSLLSSTLR